MNSLGDERAEYAERWLNQKASPHPWFTRGSQLYQLGIQALDQPVGASTIVGKPTAGWVTRDLEGEGARVEVGWMLVAMAVECWLKGLMLWDRVQNLDAYRSYREAKEDFRRAVPEDLKQLGDFQRSEICAQLSGDLDKCLEDLRRDALEIVSELESLGHRLADLAERAGVEGHSRVLSFLRSMIILGRYPGPKKVSEVPEMNQDEARQQLDSLLDSVFRRFLELETDRPSFLARF